MRELRAISYKITFNRTIKELKWNIVGIYCDHRYTFNRTIKELKCEWSGDAVEWNGSF